MLLVYQRTLVGLAQIWTMFFYQVVAALIIFQLSMLALLSLKQSVVPAILVIPLLPLTLLFMHFCSAIFKRPFQVLSLRAAVDLDEYRQVLLPMSLATRLRCWTPVKTSAGHESLGPSAVLLLCGPFCHML